MYSAALNKKMNAAAEIGRNPVSTHQIQPAYGDEQAYTGRDCRIPLARSNSQARAGTRENHFPCPADHEQDCQPDPVDSTYSCYIIFDDHTYTVLVILVYYVYIIKSAILVNFALYRWS